MLGESLGTCGRSRGLHVGRGRDQDLERGECEPAALGTVFAQSRRVASFGVPQGVGYGEVGVRGVVFANVPGRVCLCSVNSDNPVWYCRQTTHFIAP